MSSNHIIVIQYMTPQYYISFILYDLSLMTVGWKVSWTFNDCFSFATYLLQLKAFNHIMSIMIIKLIIHGVIDSRNFFSDTGRQHWLTHSLANNFKAHNVKIKLSAQNHTLLQLGLEIIPIMTLISRWMRQEIVPPLINETHIAAMFFECLKS